MQITHEQADAYPALAPFQKMQDLVFSVSANVNTTTFLRNQEIAANWHEMSWRRRLAAYATGIVGAVVTLQSMRVTGVAANELTAFDMVDMPARQEAQTVVIAAESHRASAAAPPTLAEALVMPVQQAPPEVQPASLPLLHEDFALPADINKAPEPVDLGTYNRRTGEGTVWHQAVSYADELGYDNLTEREKYVATDHILRRNGWSWHDARHLSATQEVLMPTQLEMEQVLERAGADRVHAAERPAATATLQDPDDRISIHPEPNTPNPPVAQPAVPPVPAGRCDGSPVWWELHKAGPLPWRDETPGYDCGWDARDTWLALALAGTAAGVAATQRAWNRRQQEKEAYELQNAPTEERLLTPEEQARLREGGEPVPPPVVARQTRMAALRERLRLDRINLSRKSSRVRS